MFPKIGTGKLTGQDPDRNLFVRLCNSGALNGMAIDGQFLIVAKGTPFATQPVPASILEIGSKLRMPDRALPAHQRK